MGAGTTLCKSLTSVSGTGPEVNKAGIGEKGVVKWGKPEPAGTHEEEAGTRISFIHLQTSRLQDVESLQ